MKHSTGAPTVAEAKRWDDFRLSGCIACWMLGYPETPYDVQHFLSGGVRRGHGATAPICPAHHRGVGFSPEWHFASIATNYPRFRQIFGSDDELIVLTDRVIVIEKLKRGILTPDSLTEAKETL